MYKYILMTFGLLLYSFSSTAADKSSRSKKLKNDVIEAINELIQDIDTCHEQISEQAVEHIHQKYFLYGLPTHGSFSLPTCLHSVTFFIVILLETFLKDLGL